MVVAGVGVADGALPDGALVGVPLGDLGGDGVAAGDGADHVSLWLPDFMEAGVSFGVLSLGRGVRAGFSSIGVGDKN